MIEEWRDVPGYPYYQASSWGRVRRGGRVLRGKLWRNARRTSAYREVAPSIQGRATTVRVHTMVCLAFEGARPTGAVTRHLDGDSLNNCADNLRWGTHRENHDDMRQHRRHHNSLKTNCPRCGEPYPPATCAPGEVRRCTPCRRRQLREASARHRARRSATRDVR